MVGSAAAKPREVTPSVDLGFGPMLAACGNVCWGPVFFPGLPLFWDRDFLLWVVGGGDWEFDVFECFVSLDLL